MTEKKEVEDNAIDIVSAKEENVQNDVKEDVVNEEDVVDEAVKEALNDAEKADKAKKETDKKETKKEKVKLSIFSDIFITESDTFDIEVSYYKDGEELIVSEVDDRFDPKREDLNSFVITLKYPDQGDYSAISAQAKVGYVNSNGLENLDIRDYLTLEFSRILCLMRKWNIDVDLSHAKLVKLHPKIVKSIINQVRTKIGTDGII